MRSKLRTGRVTADKGKRCGAVGCVEQIPPTREYCAGCWFRLPHGLKVRVVNAVVDVRRRPGQAAANEAVAANEAAREALQRLRCGNPADAA